VLLSLARLNRILDIDPDNAWPESSPACATWPSARPPNRMGSTTRPDPSSQIACTIGGNVAENAGGVHCLKYGLTVNNLLAVELVTIDGERVDLRRRRPGRPGLDLLALITGSEGMLGVIVEVTVKLLPSRSAPRSRWPPSTTSRSPARPSLTSSPPASCRPGWR
jgi:glycolate oxidase